MHLLALWSALASAYPAVFHPALIDALRVIAVCVWGLTVALRAGAIWRVLAGKARYYDFIWAIIGGFGAMALGFNLIRLASPNSEIILAGLHVFSILLGLLALKIVKPYEVSRRG